MIFSVTKGFFNQCRLYPIQLFLALFAGIICLVACLPPPSPSSCIEFTSLTIGTTYMVGSTFTDSTVDMTVADFQWGSGQWTSGGHVLVDNRGLANGTAQEVNLNNANLIFDFSEPSESVSLLFGEYGGNLNIDVNGDFQNFGNFEDIDQAVIGGVTASVINGLGNDQGTLELTGTIEELAIGGQELWIDDVCH